MVVAALPAVVAAVLCIWRVGVLGEGTEVVVYVTCYMLHATWYLVPGTWYRVLGTWYMVQGTGYMVQGTLFRYMVHST